MLADLLIEGFAAGLEGTWERSGRRRSREQRSRAAHQNEERSEDARQGARRPASRDRVFT
jgi:hypothetical protein